MEDADDGADIPLDDTSEEAEPELALVTKDVRKDVRLPIVGSPDPLAVVAEDEVEMELVGADPLVVVASRGGRYGTDWSACRFLLRIPCMLPPATEVEEELLVVALLVAAPELLVKVAVMVAETSTVDAVVATLLDVLKTSIGYGITTAYYE